MPIETITTDDMRAAAALISKGFPLRGGRETKRPGIIEFDLMVDESRLAEAQNLLARCDRQTQTYDLEVHLGAYEQGWSQCRNLVNVFRTQPKENGDNGSRRDPSGGSSLHPD